MITEDMSPENPTGYAIKTKCQCGIEFETHYTLENDNDLTLKCNAMLDHKRKWNTRPYEKDLIDIKVYAENIVTRCREVQKKNLDTWEIE